MFEILQKLVEKHGVKKVVEVACMILNSSVAAFEESETAEVEAASKKAASKKEADMPAPPVTQPTQTTQETQVTFPEFISECTSRGMTMEDIDAHCVKMVGVKLAEVLPKGLESKISLLVRSLPDVNPTA